MSALVSVIPILLLIVLMMGFKVSGYKSAIITLIVTIVLALFAAPAMGIVPEKYAAESIFGITLWSVIEGFLKACFPIILIIICAIFSYNILCETKEIETIKTQFIQMTSDKGLLVLLLTWGLGGVLEGMAGFGTAVAIPYGEIVGVGAQAEAVAAAVDGVGPGIERRLERRRRSGRRKQFGDPGFLSAVFFCFCASVVFSHRQLSPAGAFAYFFSRRRS